MSVEALIEERLDFSRWVPEGFGTGDMLVVGNGLLSVIDLKMGKGLQVSADDNPQLKLYALGAYERFKLTHDIETVRMVIHQPRLDSISEYEMSIEDLLEWGDSIKPVAQLAWEGKGEFVPSEECRFCPAKGNCKARIEKSLATTITDARLMSVDDISKILPQATQLKALVGDLEDYVLAQALSGAPVPGYKLVAGQSIRKYRDPDAVAECLIKHGYAEAILYERNLLGVTAMEKAIGKKDFTELLAGLVEKPIGSPTLVPASDKREAINSKASIINGFD